MTNSYYEAEFWVATKKNYTSVEDESYNEKGDQLVPRLDRQLRNSKWILPSRAKTEKSKMAVPPAKNASVKRLSNNPRKPMLRVLLKRSSSIENIYEKWPKIIRVATQKLSDSSTARDTKEDQSVIIEENIVITNYQTEDTLSVHSHKTNDIEERTESPSTMINQATAEQASSNASNLSPSSSNHSIEIKFSPSPPSTSKCHRLHEHENDKIQLESISKNRPNAIQTPPDASNLSSSPEPSNKKQISAVSLKNLIKPPTEEIVVESYDDFQTNADTTTQNVQKPSNPDNQSSCLDSFEQPYLLITKNNSLDDTRIEKVLEKSQEISQSQLKAYLLKKTSNIPTTQDLSNSVNHSSQSAFLAHRNYSIQRINRENTAINSSMPVPNSTNTSSQLPEPSEERQAPSVNENSSQKVLPMAEIQARKSAEISRLDQNAVANNTFTAQNLSNLPNQPYQYLKPPYPRHNVPDHLPYIQQSSRIQIGRSNEVNSCDQRVCSRKTRINGPYTIQNILDSVNVPNQCVQHRYESQYPSADQIYLQDPRYTQSRVIRATNVSDPSRSGSQGITRNVPHIVQNYSNALNQFNQHFEPLYQRQFQTTRRNLLHIPQNVTDMPIGANDSKQRTPHPRIMKSTSKNATQPSCSTGPIHLQSLSINRNNLLHNSHTQAMPSDIRANQLNYLHQTATSQYFAERSRPVAQNFPMQSTCSNNSLPETQFQPLDTNYLLYSPQRPKIMVDKSTEMDCIPGDPHIENHTNNSSAINSILTIANQSCQTNCSMEESPPAEETVIDNEATEETLLETTTDVDCTEQNITPERDVEDASFTIQNSSEPANPLLNSGLSNQEFLREFAALFNKLNTNFSNAYVMFAKLHSTFIRSTETFQKVEELVNNNKTDNSNGFVSSSSNTTEFEEVRKEQNGVKIAETSNTHDNDNEDSKINLGHRHTFTLPPEYDPNDSKWTLKYRKRVPGLVDLMPQSGIYVNAIQLANCIRTAKDCKSMARMLLTEVFSENALKVCSLTGTRAKAFNDKNMDVRPGLNEFAKMVLLSFVEEYGLKHNWDTFDTQSVINSIRSKIKDIRAKHGK